MCVSFGVIARVNYVLIQSEWKDSFCSPFFMGEYMKVFVYMNL